MTVASSGGIPLLKRKQIQFRKEQENITWTFIYYDEFNHLFSDGEIVQQSFEFLLNLDERGYRRQFHFQSVPFLIGVLPNENEVRFLSPRAHQESFLLDKLTPEELAAEDVQHMRALKSHTEKVLKLNLYNFPSVIEQISNEYNLSDLDEKKYIDLNENINKYRFKLTKEVENYRASIFERFSDYGLTLTANYDLIRVHLLKFVAILASLEFDESGSEVKRILVESLRRLLKDSTKAKLKSLKGSQKALPTGLWILFWIVHKIATYTPAKLLTWIVKTLVRGQAKRFIAGETIESSESALKELIADGRDATLDQLGELVVSKKEADNYKNEVIKLIKGFSDYVEPGEKNASGIYRAHVSIKVSALSNDFNPEAFNHTYKSVYPRLKEILVTAKINKVYINIDAEHYHYRDMVLEIYKKTLLETDELKDYAQTGIVLQGYLRDAYPHLEEIIKLAKQRNICMPIRLVKGAYWDAETVEAQAHSFDAPEFLNKEETDIHYRQLIIEILENYPFVQLCLGGHNLRDHCFAEALRDKYYRKTPVIEHQCLHMTFEALSVGMQKMGWVSRNYVPIGSLLVGMAYLVRRIMENSSQVGVLTQMRSHKNYEMVHPQTLFQTKIDKKQISFDETITKIGNYFFNISPVQLYLDRDKKWWSRSIENITTSFGKTYKNSFLENGEEQEIFSSSVPDVCIGKINFANVDQALLAIDASEKEYKEGVWSNYSFYRRASVLLSVSSEMLSRRLELAALIVYEAGKSQNEALADVDEAIDFLNFYSRLGRTFEEKDSRGVTAVISPWNFPIAIPAGMVSGPLVCGNTVILKSAEETPLIAQVLVDMFHRNGVPQNALIHLPGVGEKVGAKLVESKKISTYVFTGSKAVGVLIAKQTAGRIYTNPKNQMQYPVKVITEMGGKNAIIVTANAELDETVEGVMYSAFAHAGQKCSACSRVIIDNRIKDIFLERFKEAASDIEVGVAFNEETYINPLITKQTQDRVRLQSDKIVSEAKEHKGKVFVNRAKEKGLPGFCVGPMVVELPFHRGFESDSYSQRELFAPIVHVIGFDGPQQAVDLFNSTPYGLTGGIYSQSQDDIDFFTAKMKCGNLYVNRPNTGARVGIEPFGGFKLSGTGPKAGTHYYLNGFSIQPEETKITPVNNHEGGSDYDFDLAQPGQLNEIKRIENFLKGLNFYLNQFEDIYQGIYATNKASVSAFTRWSEKEFLNYISIDHDNVVIPGQMSFDNFQIKKRTIVYIAEDLSPNPKNVISLFSAIGLGIGATIVCRNHDAYLMWNKIVDCFYSSGISNLNLAVYHVSEERYLATLKNTEVEVFIFDGDISNYSQTAYKAIENHDSDKQNFLTKFITSYDAPDLESYEDFILQFIEVRSFAINTMRHGAPLEIQL